MPTLPHPSPIVVFEHHGFQCRRIQPTDDPAVRDLIINTLTEFGCVGEGYACADEETQTMSRFYDNHSGTYWVIESADTGCILGGGGFSRLKGTTQDESVCEVQKLYFDPSVRGKGLGARLLSLIVEEAAKAGYRQAYLETIPQMKHAQSLYTKLGFTPITCHMGATGHHKNCTVRMVKSLSDSSHRGCS